MSQQCIVVIGGGAGGFFGAINAAAFHPDADIILLEKNNKLLSKVKISGGGRCNVTHHCFDDEKLLQYYPRGKDFLLPVFNQFGPKSTVGWFAERGVKIKTEADGRMFPESNSSQTIIDCFLEAADRAGIKIHTQTGVEEVQRFGEQWKIITNEKTYVADKLLIAPGSTPQLWKLFERLGHHIIPPVPSLFTFNIKDPRIDGLMGVAAESAGVKISGTEFKSEGPLLITHWGMSGPAILRLSSFAAVELAAKNYQFEITVNWIGKTEKEALAELKKLRDEEAKKLIGAQGYFGLPKRLWKSLTAYLVIDDLKWASSGNKQLEALAKELTGGIYSVNGKSTFKDEFVTAGGIDLSEVKAETMESKLLPGIFFSGEFLNIDAVTGGFNFQAAWSTAYVAAKNM